MLRTTEKSGFISIRTTKCFFPPQRRDKFWISRSLPHTSGFLSKGKCPGCEADQTQLQNVCVQMYYFFRLIPRRLNFICRRFGTPCLFHLYRRCKQEGKGESLKSRLRGDIHFPILFIFWNSEYQEICMLFNLTWNTYSDYNCLHLL
jgi:hypothetical protein